MNRRTSHAQKQGFKRKIFRLRKIRSSLAFVRGHKIEKRDMSTNGHIPLIAFLKLAFSFGAGVPFNSTCNISRLIINKAGIDNGGINDNSIVFAVPINPKI
ncbi:MAG TPA: hypothetical protein DCY74_06915, partial [Clostridiales bacterium]|nr:hypothetical protein [Clostridiales bacterium]